jgi:hypothetical protein
MPDFAILEPVHEAFDDSVQFNDSVQGEIGWYSLHTQYRTISYDTDPEHHEKVPAVVLGRQHLLPTPPPTSLDAGFAGDPVRNEKKNQGNCTHTGSPAGGEGGRALEDDRVLGYTLIVEYDNGSSSLAFIPRVIQHH